MEPSCAQRPDPEIRPAGLRSPFSSRHGAAAALADVIGGIRARHLFVSYGSEGILSREAIAAMLSAHGVGTDPRVGH